jgi:hypothetical protein
MQTMYQRDQAHDPTVRPWAEDTACEDVESFGNWLAWNDCGPREPSAYFTSISIAELAQMLINADATDKQLAAAARELRQRFLADNADLVAQIEERTA